MQEVIAVCAFCGNELYEGDEVLLIDGGIDVYVCDEVCLVDYLLKTGDVKKVVLKLDKMKLFPISELETGKFQYKGLFEPEDESYGED